ncbi:hypothetical protein CONLIGDRAFT_641416 [Coniochaeta ligniaria NRRL 30616]|uniref:PA14 domain-containing protein n=1 Tax=Coniochaeta ligniaria NRRL 30616 TaxID=1408157 RepID=A0A1J7IWR1_9PEZI|nr:hypothetical protein CONLIGDRAFT_641416 [Coniochaeta ligniaria NRRL 30616]
MLAKSSLLLFAAGLAAAKTCSPAAASCALVPSAAISASCSSYLYLTEGLSPASAKIKTTSCTSTVTANPSTVTKVVTTTPKTTVVVGTVTTRTIQETKHRSSTSVTSTIPTTVTTTIVGTETSTTSITDVFTTTTTASETITTTALETIRFRRRGIDRRDPNDDCSCFITATTVVTTTPKAVTETSTSTLPTSTVTSTNKGYTTITVSNVGTTLSFSVTSTAIESTSTTATVPGTFETSITVPATETATLTETATSTLRLPSSAPVGNSGYLQLRPAPNSFNGVSAKYCLSDAAGHLTDSYNSVYDKEQFIVTPEGKLYSITHNAYYRTYDNGGYPQTINWQTDPNFGSTNFHNDPTTLQPDGSTQLLIEVNGAPGTYYKTCIYTAANGNGGTTGLHVNAYLGTAPTDCIETQLWFGN